MKKNKLTIVLFSMFVILLCLTIYTGLGVMADEPEVVVNSITALYDENSGVVVTQDSVTFNDKNQVVNYKVEVKNTQDYDIKINNISLSTPTEKFLSYEIEGAQTEDIIKANSKRVLFVSFETTGIKGWGRNFSDELTANISFEKVEKQEEVIPPVEEEDSPKEDEIPKQEENSKPNEGGGGSKPESQPVAPAKNEEELIKNVEKLEKVVVTKNTIELSKEIKVDEGEKIEVWIYSEPIFLGYFDVVIENGVKKIEGLEEALAKADIESGEHNLVLVSNEETIGYVPVTINEDKEILIDDNKRDEAIENPYTSDNKLLTILIFATFLTGLSLVVVSKNKVTKYMVFATVLGTTLVPISAESSIELPLSFIVNFDSQNVMKANGCSNEECVDYWQYSRNIKNFYIQNEITEIKNYNYKFDVTEKQNGRVNAYLVAIEEDSSYYDLYLQADGIIYANEDSSSYFSFMMNLDSIDNLIGMDTSNVTNMSKMFYNTGFYSKSFELDLSDFNTSNVTNMDYMFYQTGYNNPDFTLTLDDKFDTSKVIYMNALFYLTGYYSTDLNISITISNPNTNYDPNTFSAATRPGVKINVSWTKGTELLVSNMVAKSSNNVVRGDCIDCGDDYVPIGTEIVVENEKFNVISDNGSTLTMLAQYNVGEDFKQSISDNKINFSNSTGWNYTPGPKEVDIFNFDGAAKELLNGYKIYLQTVTEDTTIKTDMITLQQLKGLGCSVSHDYSWYGGNTCSRSYFKNWLLNDKIMWTRSAYSGSANQLWIVLTNGDHSIALNNKTYGIRPVVTISKETLKKIGQIK